MIYMQNSSGSKNMPSKITQKFFEQFSDLSTVALLYFRKILGADKKEQIFLFQETIKLKVSEMFVFYYFLLYFCLLLIY